MNSLPSYESVNHLTGFQETLQSEESARKLGETQKNIASIDQPIKASNKLISYIQDAKDHAHNRKFSLNNQTLLYYALAKEEKGRIGTNAIAFMDSRGSLLIPFLIEYDITQKRVRIVNEHDSEESKVWFKYMQSINSTYRQSFEENKKDIFRAISEL